MNRNNETGTMKQRRGYAPHLDIDATVVKTLRAASLQAAIASRRDAMLVANNATTPATAPRRGATPLPVTCYPLQALNKINTNQ